MEFMQAGDRGVLVDLGDVSSDELHAAAATARSIPGLSACVVGHSSLLLLGVSEESARAALRSTHARVTTLVKQHRFEVSFDEDSSPDLALLLDRTGMSRDRFLDAVSALELRARFLGFLAGFAYLEGIPESWMLPRRPTPRLRVPRGSFAIGGEMAAFYPVDSPGGWNILGRTSALLWDEHREPPALIAAGDEIEIVPTPTPISEPERTTRNVEIAAPVASVIASGQRTLLVTARDLRRYDFGLSPGGPFDPEAAAAANRAAGNPSDAPILECVFVGPDLQFHQERRLAWYGAVSNVPRQIVVKKDEVLRVGPLRQGIRGYLAIEGGWVSSAPRYSIAPEVVTPDTPLQATEACATRARIPSLTRERPAVLRVAMGPHEVTREQRDLLQRMEWEVAPASDRVGVRFRVRGAISVEPPAMMRSCGVQFGTVQWHPDGSLVAMGPDHPITGGYLQPMTILSPDLWKLAQLAPGMRVRFAL